MCQTRDHVTPHRERTQQRQQREAHAGGHYLHHPVKRAHVLESAMRPRLGDLASASEALQFEAPAEVVDGDGAQHRERVDEEPTRERRPGDPVSSALEEQEREIKTCAKHYIDTANNIFKRR